LIDRVGCCRYTDHDVTGCWVAVLQDRPFPTARSLTPHSKHHARRSAPALQYIFGKSKSWFATMTHTEGAITYHRYLFTTARSRLSSVILDYTILRYLLIIANQTLSPIYLPKSKRHSSSYPSCTQTGSKHGPSILFSPFYPCETNTPYPSHHLPPD
jgi:hypothetical protein